MGAAWEGREEGKVMRRQAGRQEGYAMPKMKGWQGCFSSFYRDAAAMPCLPGQALPTL